ncbi:MAG: 4Fe-4S dicluster domain-containing protein [Dehalococcoidales bacterium]|nr:4Fe-4S dicluster domain-containing protein [Dehalococcoidales bacterium]
MESRIIQKKDIANLLNRLSAGYEILAPVERDSIILFEAITSGDEAILDYHNSKIPPKRALFAQKETLFRYSSAKDADKIEVPPAPEKPRLIFGIHPCDARSFTLLDRVFDGVYQDPYYLQRRANTIVVSLGCLKPGAGCFCTSVGGGPFSTEGSDIMLTDIGDEYLAQALTDRGRQLLADAPETVAATEDELSLAQQVTGNAEAAIPPVLNTEGLKEKLDSLSAAPVWHSLAEKCLGCGVCTYLCPTCHCFDIVDERAGDGGERLRIWDSCQFPLFTLQASGMNPRHTVKERLRQRVMDKFSYTVDHHGRISCVGCGRCVTECPVNLDIRRVVNTILEVKASG